MTDVGSVSYSTYAVHFIWFGDTFYMQSIQQNMGYTVKTTMLQNQIDNSLYQPLIVLKSLTQGQVQIYFQIT